MLLLTATVALSACQAPQAQSYNQPPVAGDDFDKAANRPPTAETLYRMSKILAAQHKDEQCEAVLRNCIQRYPDYAPGYAELAQLQVRERKMAAAIGTLKDGLIRQPKDPVLLNDLGMCCMLSSDYEAALAQFTAATEADPDNARYTANQALATGMLGRYEHALTLYEKIARPGPAHYNVAVVAEARNDMSTANQYYAEALALDPWCQRKSRSGDK
jgi:tetratricopeptide (TPR) repeat protein